MWYMVQFLTMVAQMVKRLPAMRETRARFLGQEDPLEKEMAIHSSTLAWKIPWTEEPDRLQSMGSQRVGWRLHYWGKDSGKGFFANWKKHMKRTDLSFLLMLSCLNVTPGAVAAISRPSQGQTRLEDKANFWKMAEQGIGKNLDL